MDVVRLGKIQVCGAGIGLLKNFFFSPFFFPFYSFFSPFSLPPLFFPPSFFWRAARAARRIFFENTGCIFRPPGCIFGGRPGEISGPAGLLSEAGPKLRGRPGEFDESGTG